MQEVNMKGQSVDLGLTIGNLTIAIENNKTSFHKYISKKWRAKQKISILS